MPRLIRRKPLADRIRDYLHPGDFLLWLSEEIETRDWDSKHVATPLAVGLHFTLLIARANAGKGTTSGDDDVFGEDYSRTGWLSYIVSTFRIVLSVVMLTRIGYISCIFTIFILDYECCIHVLTEATLSSLRKLSRCAPEHSFCAPCTSRLFTCIFLPTAIVDELTRK